MVKQFIRFSCAGLALAALIGLSSCDFVVQPLGGAEGHTQVYVAMGKLGVPNAGIICTRMGAVVIDPGLSPTCGSQLNAQANAKSALFWDLFHKARGDRPRTLAPPVLYVLNTTFRASHTFGNQVFDKADIISTPKARDRMDLDGDAMREELRDQWHVPGLELHVTTSATLTVDGTLTLNTPDIKIQFISVGDCVGEGDAVVYLPGQKVLFAGDLVLPGYIPYYKGRTPTVRAWIAALKGLEKLDIETIVPGHGEISKKAALGNQREFLEALVGQVEAAIKAGQTADQAAGSVKLPAPYSTWPHYNDWLGENVKLVYAELKSTGAPGGSKVSSAGAGAVPPGPLEQPDGIGR